MFANYRDPSAIPAFTRPDSILRVATILRTPPDPSGNRNAIRRRGLARSLRAVMGRGAMAIAVLTALAVAPAAGQTVATVTIAAEREAYILGLDDVAFVLTRSGATDGELAVGVKLSQTQGFLDASSLMQTVTFAPDASIATLTIARSKFLSAVTRSGALSAEVAPGDKQYEVGMPSPAAVRLVAANPAITVRHERASYIFAEGADGTNRAVLVARTASGIPKPGSVFNVSLVTRAVTGGAASPGDYRALSVSVAFAPDDFAAIGGAWEARREMPVGVVDDSEVEEDEAFDLVLERSPGLPAVVALRDVDGTTPCGTDGCAASLTIRDNDGPEPAAIAGIAFASPAGTYAIGDEIRVSVAFDKPVTVTATSAARPSLELDIGGTARQAGYRSGSGSTALVFAYAVAEGDEDADGLSIGADRLTAPAGSTIAAEGTAASLTHVAVRADPSRKVDGVRPSALYATVDRGRVIVTWDEALRFEEGLGIPGGHALVVGGMPRPIAAVGVSERRVTLALDGTVGNGEWVTVSYGPPETRPIRDAAGNRAAGFSLTVTAGERGICSRTPVVRDRIMVLLRHAVKPGYPGDCAGVTAEMLARIRSMDIVPPLERVTTLRAGDFAGLSGMRSLYIVEHPGLTALETGVFRGLTRLETLRLHENGIATVRGRAFQDLPALRLLSLRDNRIATLAAGAFEALGALEFLSLQNNRLAAFPFDEFEELPKLGRGTHSASGLYLSGNPGYVNGVQATQHSLAVAPGGIAAYRLRLTAAPSTAGARVAVTPPEGLSASPEAVVFDGRGKDWFRAREVAVTAAPGTALGEARVTHEVTSRNYASFMREPAPSVTVRIAGTARADSPALTVADAGVREGPGAILAFAVTLSSAQQAAVTVDWVTKDGTARAGADYEASSGMLRFDPGETVKKIPVAVIDDSHDEGSETLTLALGNASGARIADATAIGTIVNGDAMPVAWLTRFGRTAVDQVLAAVTDRMAASRKRGFEGRLAGMRVGGNPAEREKANDAPRGETRSVGGRDILTGTGFALSGETDDGEVGAVWGRAAITRFDGREGDLSLDGEVTTGILGGDWTNGQWTGGLAISRSDGSGAYRGGGGGGEVDSALVGFWPWGGYAISERVSVWALGGYGKGRLTLTPSGGTPIAADIDMRAAAAGLRGALIAPSETSGFALAAISDAMLVRTDSDAAPGLAAASAGVTRLRLGLEGSWRAIEFDGGRLIPGFEIGIRRDGGDAETGFGLDFGGGIAWENPSYGLRAEANGRALLAHADEAFRERGFSGSLVWNPDPATALGPSLSLRQTLGAPAAGGKDALLRREIPAAPGAGGKAAASRRFEATIGYGLPLAGGRFAGTPELGLGLSDSGRELRLAWHVGPAAPGGPDLDFRLEGTRRESAGGGRGPEHAIRLGLTLRR